MEQEAAGPGRGRARRHQRQLGRGEQLTPAHIELQGAQHRGRRGARRRRQRRILLAAPNQRHRRGLSQCAAGNVHAITVDIRKAATGRAEHVAAHGFLSIGMHRHRLFTGAQGQTLGGFRRFQPEPRAGVARGRAIEHEIGGIRSLPPHGTVEQLELLTNPQRQRHAAHHGIWRCRRQRVGDVGLAALIRQHHFGVKGDGRSGDGAGHRSRRRT